MRLMQVVLAVGFLVHFTTAFFIHDNNYYDGNNHYDNYRDVQETGPKGHQMQADKQPEPEPAAKPQIQMKLDPQLESQMEPKLDHNLVSALPDRGDHALHYQHNHGATLPQSQPELEDSGDNKEDAEILPDKLDDRVSVMVQHLSEVESDEMDENGDNITKVEQVDLRLNAAFQGITPVSKIPEICTQPLDPGVCRGYFPMFYFDPVTRKCLQFVYGGCRGNSNAFTTAKECYEKCHAVGFSRGGGNKDDYLMLHNGTGNEMITFTGHDAALRIDDSSLSEFSVRNVYQLEFFFRTDSPHGLIAYLRQTSVPPELDNKRVQLYVFLRRGHLGVTHMFCCRKETFLMKKGGMQAGNWHSVLVKVDSGTGELFVEVDGAVETFTITSLRDKPHYDSNEDAAFTPRLWIGGVFEEKAAEEEMVDRTKNFHGCMKRIALMSGVTSETMVWHKNLRSSVYRNVKERCWTSCDDQHKNQCSRDAHCIEHFDYSTCNCFGTNMDGPHCFHRDTPILTLSNEGHIVHRLYEWMDRVHTYNNFISLEFRTRFTDSILFYGSSEYPEKQYIAATLTTSGSIYVEANLGGGLAGVEVGRKLHSGSWHTLVVIHQHNKIQIHLDSVLRGTFSLPGEVRYFHFDPDFYIGSAPNLTRTCGLMHDKGTQEGYYCQANQTRYYYDVHSGECHTFNYNGCGGNGNNFQDKHTCISTCNLQGLRSMHSFLGCLNNVYVNDVSVLWELESQKKRTRYYGATELAPFTDTCNDHEMMVVLTLSTEKAHINLTDPDPKKFNIIASFRPTKTRGVLASGYVDVLDNMRLWEIHHDEQYISFVIYDDLMHVKPNTKIRIGVWQFVEVRYSNGKIIMKVNHKTVSKKPPAALTFRSYVTIGLSPFQEYPGMVGCLRRLELGGEEVELRSLGGTDLAQKNVIYDGCRVLAPCERPGSCEHGSKCILDHNDDIKCDCLDLGYTGKTCHFSMYKSSCEEYRQIGYNTSGVYKIDVDGNGPHPPSFVTCEFNHFTGLTSTIVENNLAERYEVRGPDLGNLKIDVKYRDFTPGMLQTLVTQSESCTQKVSYECRRAPLKLSTDTWFSSPTKAFISNFGSKIPGLCRCKEIGACDKEDVPCNCDVMDGLARVDTAVISDPHLLPLTSMVFLESKEGMADESEGRITLNDLVCTKEATVQQTVSFTKDDVYLEVPAWREGSLAFSFKTTSSRAIIAYQPAYHPKHATFRIALLGDNEIEFMYSFHGLKHRHSQHTTHRLNTGEWQQILIDVHQHQLRFLINTEQKLIDVDEKANLGVLDGSMFLGGMPPRQSPWKSQEVKDEEKFDGLKGCIRDLTLNHELLDLSMYIKAAPLGVSSSCKPACDPNPCKNDAKCIESWGSYQCVCENPLAHSGTHCEKDLNEDAVTFTTKESKLKYCVNETVDISHNDFANITSLLLNFRTHASEGLILFIYDYLHNFLQLHLASPTKLVLLFNHGKQAKSLYINTENVLLNEGQSVQVSLERNPYATNLSVFTNGVTFKATSEFGLMLIQETEYEQFPFGEVTPLPGMVYYPHSFAKPEYFFKVYVGSANDPQWDVRAEVPGIVGCLRGLQVNSKPVGLRNILKHFPDEGVKKDCTMVCDLQPCLNGGICKEDFAYPSNFHCNCFGTSFTGPICTTETAYTFHGEEWLSRASSTSPLVEGLVLELAFSAYTRRIQPQLVSFLRSTNPSSLDDYILVAVESDGAVTVKAQLESLESDTTLVATASPAEGINAFSGNRHSVRIEWSSVGLSVSVDRMELVILREAARYKEEVNTSPNSLYLGGVEDGIDNRLKDCDNFHGCISNVIISNLASKVFPLQEYKENDLHITNFGLPSFGSCSGFPLLPALYMEHKGNKEISPVKGGEWNFRAAHRTSFEAPPPITAPKRNTSMDNVVPAVAGSVLLVTGIIVAILCVRSNTKSKKKKKQVELKEEEERQTFLKQRKKTKEHELKAPIEMTSTVEMKEIKPSQNGRTQVNDVKTIKVQRDQEQQQGQQQQKLDETPSMEPPVSSQINEPREGVLKRSSKEFNGDRPLSWDKSVDTLPLIIGTEKTKTQKEPEDSSSEGSSFDCTIDITGSPSGSTAILQQRELGVADSPSSMRVHHGSASRVNFDEDTDPESEPRLLHHGPLPNVDLPEVHEPLVVKTKVNILGSGEVQKIENSEDENEIIVVDDYLENTESVHQKNIAEATQETNQTEREANMKTDTASLSNKEGENYAEFKKDIDDQTLDNADIRQEKEPSTNKKKGDDKAEKQGDTKSTESDDDFIELRPESEEVQDAERITIKRN